MSINNFWKDKKTECYLICYLFEIDEVVRKYGGCPNDEDYKIIRTYFYWELEEEGIWEKTLVTKQDYEKSNNNPIYGTELNYAEFESKFWFDEFKSFLTRDILPIQQVEFTSLIQEHFNNVTFEGQAKLFLKDVVANLIESIESLKILSRRIKKEHLPKLNEIQSFVINKYIENYTDTIRKLIKNYKSISPVLINESVQEITEILGIEKEYKENPYPKVFKNLDAFLIFKSLHNSYKNDSKINLANYSFVYYSMEKDNLIICGNIGFIEHLSEIYDISLPKIDSRQSGSNKRTNFYKSIRDKFIL
jgi:hypothetical protein